MSAIAIGRAGRWLLGAMVVAGWAGCGVAAGGRDAAAGAPLQATIETQGFEWSTFPPAGWRRVDYEALQAGQPDQYVWSRETCDVPPNGGSASAWAVGDGARGGGLACAAPYPDIVDSWLIYGPIDVQPYPGGLRVTMDAKLDQMYDTGFLVCVTTDDPNAPLSCYQSQQLATAWHVFGPLSFARGDGQTSTEVWIGYRDRQPDGTHFGAFVDNVVIEGVTTAPASGTPPPTGATPTGIPTATASASPTSSRTATPTPSRTATPTPTRTPTASPSRTISATPSVTATGTSSRTPGTTPSRTPTAIASGTDTPRASSTATSSATPAPTRTNTATLAPGTATPPLPAPTTPPAVTPTRTSTPPATRTATSTQVPSATVDPTRSSSPTITGTPSALATERPISATPPTVTPSAVVPTLPGPSASPQPSEPTATARAGTPTAEVATPTPVAGTALPQRRMVYLPFAWRASR